jgi:hypothetical protein
MTAISYLIEVVVARPAAEIQRPAAPGRRPFSDVSHYVFREPDGPAMRPERLAAVFMQYSSKFIANPSNLRLGRLRYAAERAIYRGPSGQGGRSGGLPRPDDALPATALALCTALAVAAAVLLPPYPPLQDFIEWIYQAEILAQLPSEAWPPGVHVATYPVPNSLFRRGSKPGHT